MDALMLPLNWQRVRLGDIAEIKRGASPRPIENPKWFCANSNVGWVRISDISKNSRFLYKTAQKLSKKGIEKSRFIKQNSLIMSMCATIGKPIITKIDTCIHDGFVVFENPKIDLNYLYYFLCYIEKEWLESGQQGSQVNLNVDLIKNKEVFYPKDLNEQIAIANILSDVDHYLCSLDALILKKESVKKALSFELLSQRKRLKGFNQAWQKVRLGTYKYRRGSFPQPYGNPQWYSDNGMPFVQVYDVGENFKLTQKTKQKISKIAQPMSVFVPKNSVIITLQGTIGRVALTQYDCYCDRTILIFDNNTLNDVNKYFFVLSLFTKFEEEKRKADGSIIKTITKQTLKDFEIPLPPLNEQSAIANILSALDKEIESLKNKKRQFENIKKALNHDLMSAKIRVLKKIKIVLREVLCAIHAKRNRL
ncbi:restriction endonuclease subunit S [Helicobacter pylori]|uniref:restriction endonuclease subunit S n=1 Tax=Helicobacter pylori TaxID=210 RepID=UPI00257499DB|nr:restriction endonuclease subunit S [Helicobacter pylori]WJI92693.1 restriction endonuclease subunit S [Helicobacter pylori]